MGSVGCGRRTITATVKYDWYIEGGIEIDARWRYGGLSPVILIRKEELRTE